MKAPGWLLLTLSMAAPSAHALKDGDTIYVKARNTKLLVAAKADADAKAVLRVGEPLLWRQKDAGGFHRVSLPGKTEVYFVYGANLSLQAPRQELWTASSTRVDTKAFASSGAATKGLSEGAFQMAVNDAQLERAARDLVALEVLQAQVTEAEVDAHLRGAKLAEEPAP